MAIMRHLLLMALPATLLAAAAPLAPAHACSPPYPGLTGRKVHPPPSSVGVPVNARVLVRYQGGFGQSPRPDLTMPAVGGTLALREAGGAAVTVGKAYFGSRPTEHLLETVVALEPAQALKPNTAYEVVDGQLQLPCVTPAGCAFGAPEVIGTFTTGTSTDAFGPSTNGSGVLNKGQYARCDQGACCGPYWIRYYGAVWAAAEDDAAGKAVLYNLYKEGTAEPLVPFLELNRLTVAVSCSGLTDPNALRLDQGSYTVKAVDWAGNESVTFDFVIEFPCGEPPERAEIDGGNDVTRDAGAEAVETAAPDGPRDAALPLDGPQAPDVPSGSHADVPRATGGPSTSDAGSPSSPPRRSDGGGCAVGGAGSAALPALAFLLLAVGCRRRPRQR